MYRHESVLVALRQIIRATELYSRKLSRVANLTAPQLLIMQAIEARQSVWMSDLANEVSISQATVTSIIDRLEKRSLVIRRRDVEDRRRVYAELTDAGRALLQRAPSALQDSFVNQFEQLKEWEQLLILSSLQRVAAMMNADQIDASPVLDLGVIDRPQELEDMSGQEESDAAARVVAEQSNA